MKGKNNNFTVKKPGRRYLHQVTKFNYHQWLVIVITCILTWCDEKSTSPLCCFLFFCVFSFFYQTHNLSLIMKNVRQIQSEGHSTKYLTSTLEKCQRHEKTGKMPGELSQIRRASGYMTAKCNVESQFGSYKKDIGEKLEKSK